MAEAQEVDIQALADRLRRTSPFVAERLDSLREALDPDGDASGWAGVDAFAALDPAGTAQDIRNAALWDPRLAQLERLRNVLALMPVLLTWFGLMFAAFGYNSAISANEALITRPFLLLWEQGFGGQLSAPLSFFSFLTFSHVAIGDVVLLAAVIFLTWQIHSEVNVRQIRRERLARQAEQDLRQVAWTAALQFAQRTSPQANDDRSRQVLEALLDELRAERERGRQIASQRERETTDLRTFGSEFRAGAQNMQRLVSETRGTFDAMLQVVANLDDRIGDLAQGQALVEQDLAHLAASVADFKDVQARASADTAVIAERLGAAAERAAEASHAVTQVAQVMRERVESATGQLQAVAAAQADMSRGVTDGLRLVTNAGEALRTSSESVHAVAETLRVTAPEIATAATRQAAAADAQTEAARVTAQAGEAIAHTLQQFETAQAGNAGRTALVMEQLVTVVANLHMALEVLGKEVRESGARTPRGWAFPAIPLSNGAGREVTDGQAVGGARRP